VPQGPDRDDRAARGRDLAGREGADLLAALGHAAEPLPDGTLLLLDGAGPVAVAVVREPPGREAAAPRRDGLSPVSRALVRADAAGLDWVVAVRGDRLRLHPARAGGRGRTGTYVEARASLLGIADPSLLPFLFSPEALRPGGAVPRLLDASRAVADRLSRALHGRIRGRALPLLAGGVVAAGGLADQTADDLDRAHRTALTILLRLLVLGFAGAAGLPDRAGGPDGAPTLTGLTRRIAARGRPPASGTGLWDDASHLWSAVAEGGPLATLRLPDAIMEPALRDVLLDGCEPVDFGALPVRELGAIYEGLLETELSVAGQDLALDARGSHWPARGAAAVVVPRGEVYLHDRSGARKASGSYFTKGFVVEHLLDQALAPALEDHLARLRVLGEADAARAFFDFRAVDAAMGAGHFLVAALDRIERAFLGYLAEPDAPGAAGARAEIAALGEAAARRGADPEEIEDAAILRRIVAERCLYGVDLNPLAAELGRLATGLHAHVPGLGAPALARTLVVGDALVGIGSLDEVEDALGGALPPGDASDELEAWCDVIAARRIDPSIPDPAEVREAGPVREHPARRRAADVLDGLQALHFPVAFPEVFLRRRSGFDVVLGNPPWQEPTVEDHAFWARHFRACAACAKRIWRPRASA
jgi:hypothetical protein